MNKSNEKTQNVAGVASTGTQQIFINKIAESFQIDFAELPNNSQQYIIGYGMKQSLNDATASIKDSDFKSKDEFISAVKLAVTSRIDKLLAGTPPAVGNGGVANPVDKRAYEILSAVVRKQGIKKADLPKTLVELAEIVHLKPEQVDKLRIKAKAQLELEASFAGDILSSLD